MTAQSPAMVSPRLWLLALGVFREILLVWRQWRESKKTAALRADPAAHWVRRLGGTDRRKTPPNAENAGGRGDA